MTEKELIACIALVVIICFIIAALLGAMREVSQAEDTIWNHDIPEAILRDRLENQKETIRGPFFGIKSLKEAEDVDRASRRCTAILCICTYRKPQRHNLRWRMRERARKISQ